MSASVRTLQPRPEIPPVPVTAKGLLELRVAKKKPSVIEAAEAKTVDLWENADFRNRCEAVFNEQAVEGSLRANYYSAAGMMRDAARKDGANSLLATANLETVRHAMYMALRRFGMTPKQRRAAYLAKATDEALDFDDSGGGK